MKMTSRWVVQILFLFLAITLSGCTVANKNAGNTGTANKSAANEPDRGTTGVEKVKPAPGTGTVAVSWCGIQPAPVHQQRARLCTQAPSWHPVDPVQDDVGLLRTRPGGPSREPPACVGPSRPEDSARPPPRSWQLPCRALRGGHCYRGRPVW